MKKLVVLSVVLLAIFFSTAFSVTAQAYTPLVDSPNPTFGLYCEQDGIIKSGTVKFDLTNSEMFRYKRALKESEYTVSGNQAVTFEIPFYSKYANIPKFNVTVNGQAVEGEVWYGDNDILYGGDNSYLEVISNDNKDIEQKLKNTYSPILDETIVGTLYTVIPDSDTLAVAFNIEQSCSYVIEDSNWNSQSNKPDGSKELTYDNALLQPCYQYFFVGDVDFTASCEYQTETIPFKEFIDRVYTYAQELYEMNRVEKECLYSNANKLLSTNNGVTVNEFFGKSLYREGINSYKFTVPLNGETTIKYSTEVVIQANGRYVPTVYLIGQKQIGSYPTKYTITLNSDVPYIIESSVKTKKSKNTYTAQSTENFYFACCSATVNGLTTTHYIILIVGGSIIGCLLIGLCVYLIYCYRQKKKYEKMNTRTLK